MLTRLQGIECSPKSYAILNNNKITKSIALNEGILASQNKFLIDFEHLDLQVIPIAHQLQAFLEVIRVDHS